MENALPSSDIFEAFRDIALQSGAETLIPISHGLSFVDACDAHGLTILGIDGFEKYEQGIRPRLDLIADFSPRPDDMQDSYREKCSSASRAFIRFAAQQGDVYLSFVLEEPST